MRIVVLTKPNGVCDLDSTKFLNYLADAAASCASLELLLRDRRESRCRRRASGRSATAGEPCWCACNRPDERKWKLLNCLSKRMHYM